MANASKSVKKPKREELDEALPRIRGQKSFYDEQRKRGTYSRSKRALLEKRTQRT